MPLLKGAIMADTDLLEIYSTYLVNVPEPDKLHVANYLDSSKKLCEQNKNNFNEKEIEIILKTALELFAEIRYRNYKKFDMQFPFNDEVTFLTFDETLDLVKNPANIKSHTNKMYIHCDRDLSSMNDENFIADMLTDIGDLVNFEVVSKIEQDFIKAAKSVAIQSSFSTDQKLSIIPEDKYKEEVALVFATTIIKCSNDILKNTQRGMASFIICSKAAGEYLKPAYMFNKEAKENPCALYTSRLHKIGELINIDVFCDPTKTDDDYVLLGYASSLPHDAGIVLSLKSFAYTPRDNDSNYDLIVGNNARDYYQLINCDFSN